MKDRSITRTAAATLEDVASAAGVSPATVSRVINGRPVVAEATRQRVLDAIERLSFRPDSLGRALATRRTGTLGLVIADITNPFYPEIVRGVEQAAAQYGLSVLLYDTAEDSEREAQALRQLRERRVDGIIVCASRLAEDRILALARPDTPLVLINRRLTGRPDVSSPAMGEQGRLGESVCSLLLPLPFLPEVATASLPAGNIRSGAGQGTNQELACGTVEADQEAGVREAVQYLGRLGHRRIAYVGGPAASQVQERRLTAFRKEIASLGLGLPPSLLLQATPTIDGGKDVGRALLEAQRSAQARPSAILAYNDLIAIGVIVAAQELGIAVPADLSVIGHDDIPLAGLLRPALTTVRQPMRELGAQAVTLVHGPNQNGAAHHSPALVQLTPTLVVRDSTAPPTNP